MEEDVGPYCPTRQELAGKLVNITGSSVSILQDFQESIAAMEPDHQVGGLLVTAAKKIGRIQISDAWFFERFIKRRIAERGEDWPAAAALVLLAELIRFFEDMKASQLQNII